MIFLILWTVFVGAFGLIALFVGGAHHELPIFPVLMLNLIGFGPMALLIGKNVKARRKEQHQWRTYMLAEAGIPPGTGFDYYQSGRGIALNRQSKTLTLLSERRCRTFSYDELRAMGKGPSEEPVRVRSPDQQNDPPYLVLNIRYGHSTVVAIAMSDSAVRDKWVKILNQEIYDH